MHTINNLCNEHDIVLSQEQWLLLFDLPLLNTAHRDFLSVGLSAVGISSDILVGQLYGSTAILYRKCLADKINIVTINESRITAIELQTKIGLLLLINVYVPTNYAMAIICVWSRACERSGSGGNFRSLLTSFSVTPAHATSRSAPYFFHAPLCSHLFNFRTRSTPQ